MKTTRIERRALLFLNALLCITLLATPFNAAPPQRKSGRNEPARAGRVILISLDGLDARYLRRADEFGLKIPTLRRLMRDGATARGGVISIYPSLTYPAHTTIVTGARPARHSIFGNEVFDRSDPQSRNGLWFARAIRAETLWDAAAREGLEVGLVSWPVAGGAGDWNMPEFWRPGGTQADSLSDIFANARPSSLAAEITSKDREFLSRSDADEQDDMRTRFAEYIIREKRPRLMLVHLFDLDHFQHDYGPFSKEALAMLEKVDGYVERLLDAAASAGTLRETAVFVVSDHGFRPLRKLIHPGVILARAGLIELSAEKDSKGLTRAVVKDWRAWPYLTNGSCTVMLRDPNDREALLKARDAFRDFARAGAGGASAAGDGAPLRVLSPAQLARMGFATHGAFVLEAAEGYSFGGDLTGEAVAENKQRGAHGYLPTLPEYRASFIASGAGVERRGDLGTIRMTDIGPTIARTLGLTLRDAEGKPLRLR
jgi:predicted AlkP superfamily pyrophosphatase or phosphodiesterase